MPGKTWLPPRPESGKCNSLVAAGVKRYTCRGVIRSVLRMELYECAACGQHYRPTLAKIVPLDGLPPY